MDVAGYVRVSTDDQNPQRQRNSIEAEYGPDEHNIEWFVDIESGASLSREQYLDLRDRIDEFDVVVATEIDRLGRSFSELASFVDEVRDAGVDLELTQQPISTVGDDWMGDMLLNLMIVFADAERQMIRDRVQQGVEKAKEEGKRLGRPPYGYDVDDEGFLIRKPAEFHRAQEFIKEVRNGRAKAPTAEFYGIPQSARQSILKRAEKNYGVEFDNGEWKVERAKVQSGEKQLEPLEKDGDDA